MEPPTRSLVVGASAGLGRALAGRLAARGHALHLVASDARDLDAVVSDLALRFDTKVAGQALDLGSPFDATALRDAVIAHLGGLDCLFLVAGRFLEGDDPGAITPALLDRLLSVNFVSALQITNAVLEDLKASPRANCVAIGSVGAARGRGRHFVYGAAKRGLAFYYEGLRHHLAGSACRVQFYQMGYLQTQMTFGKHLLLPALAPGRAADAIVRGLDRDLGLRHLPWWWRPITTLYRAIPWPIYRRLDLA